MNSIETNPEVTEVFPVSVEQFDRLSPNHQRLAQFISKNPSFVAFASASEIGRSIDMSTATVVRFAQTLGYPGYPQFQEVVRAAYLRTLRPLESLEELPRHRRDVFDSHIHQDIDNLRRGLHSLMVDRPAAIDLAQRLARAPAVVVAASGVDAAIALVLGHYLRLLGVRSVTELRGGSELVNAIAPLGADDCFIAVEFGRTEGGLTTAVSWASSRGVFTAAITDSAYSATARAADTTLVQPTEGAAGVRSLVGPLSLVQAILGYMIQQADPNEQARFKDAFIHSTQMI